MGKILVFALVINLEQAAMIPHIEKLGSPNFRVREKHHLVLQKMLDSPRVEHHLKFLAKLRGDPEIDARLNSLTENHRSILTDYGKFPWIDAYKGYDPRYLKEAGEQYGYGSSDTDWYGYRMATELWLRDLANQGWFPSELRELQKSMIQREKHYLKYKSYPP